MNELITHLQTLRLSGMAQYLVSMEETRQTTTLSLKEGLELLLQAESDYRQNNRFERLLKKASFRYKASIEELTMDSSRGIDKTLVMRLATGNYIRNGEAILITGATGCGKSFLASALGNHACRQGFTVMYINMQKLLQKFKLTRIEGTAMKFMGQIERTDLLIIDDFGLCVLKEHEQNDFLEVIEDRHNKKATIISSQMPVSNWYDIIGEKMLADAIMDRIAHNAHRFELKGESLRKNNKFAKKSSLA
jgi:DNA replication protein DnaC